MGESEEVVDPEAPFFLLWEISRLDGLLEPSMSIPEIYLTEKDAVAAAREATNRHGSESVIYHCTPTVAVTRKPVVKRLDPKP